jgi:hypothetical protein
VSWPGSCSASGRPRSNAAQIYGGFFAVEAWYASFDQVDAADVVHLLAENRRARSDRLGTAAKAR